MVDGKLTLRVHRLEGLPQIEAKNQSIAGMYYAVRITIGHITKQGKTHGKGHESQMNEDLIFELEAADGLEDVIVEILTDQNQILIKKQIAILGDFIEGRKGEAYTLHAPDTGKTATVYLTSKWQQK